jgi:hypothetical protein
MARRDPSLLEQMAHPQHRLRIQVGVVHPLPHLQPGFLSPREANLQATAMERGDVCPQGMEKGFHLGGPKTMDHGVAEEGLEGPLVLAFHQ